MEKKYKKVFDNMYLSEETKKSIQQEAEKIRTGKQKTVGWRRRTLIRIAAAMLGVIMTSGAVTYAAQSYIKYREEQVARFEIKKEESYTSKSIYRRTC